MSNARRLGKMTAVLAASVVLVGMASWFGGAAGAATPAATQQAAVSTGQWQPLSVSPLPFYPQAAMLLADGSVMLREVTRRR